MAANGDVGITMDIWNDETSDIDVSHQMVDFGSVMASVETGIKTDTIIATGIGEVSIERPLDSRLNGQLGYAGSQHLEIEIMPPGQAQPVSKPNNGPSGDSRMESKRGRSNSNGCVTVPDKRVKIEADGETISRAELAVQQIEDGLGRHSVVDLTGKYNILHLATMANANRRR
jgi:hypothetical protein